MTTKPETPAVAFTDWLASFGAAGTDIEPFWTA